MIKPILRVFLPGSLMMTYFMMISLGSFYDSNFNLSFVQKRNIDINRKNSEQSTLQKLNGDSFRVSGNRQVEGLPIIYMITPTYRRAEQIPELIRTGQTLLHVKNLVWIVVEDAPTASAEVISYLLRFGISYIYLRTQMPSQYKNLTRQPRGVANRNVGLEWIKKNAASGVVYFGDDDNTYDLRIFEEIRWTKVVSMFPVGLVTELGVSSPIVKNEEVVGFYDGFLADRTFAVDMAGFAVNVDIIKKNPNCSMPFIEGYEEDGFLLSLQLYEEDIEPKANNCTKILVWHTQTIKNKKAVETNVDGPLYKDTNLKELKKHLWWGV